VEKLGKLDTKLKSAFYACQSMEDIEHLVGLVIDVSACNIFILYNITTLGYFYVKLRSLLVT